MALGEVLPSRSVLNPACLIGLGKGKPRSTPLSPKPFLNWSARSPPSGGSLHIPHVLNADLGHDREATDRLSINVASNMTDALIPDMGGSIFPVVALKNAMDISPADLSVPKPQRGGRQARPPTTPRCAAHTNRQAPGELGGPLETLLLHRDRHDEHRWCGPARNNTMRHRHPPAGHHEACCSCAEPSVGCSSTLSHGLYLAWS